MSGLYLKKPVVVEAWQFNGEDRCDWPAWVKGHASTALYYTDSGKPKYISIATLEGVMFANRGDWIIKGVKGELYPCKPDIFAETYDPVLPGDEIPGGASGTSREDPSASSSGDASRILDRAPHSEGEVGADPASPIAEDAV